MGKSCKLEYDSIGSVSSRCWSMSKLCSGSLTLWTVEAILIDLVDFMVRVEQYLPKDGGNVECIIHKQVQFVVAGGGCADVGW